MSYRVSFYREVLNSYGKPFKAPVYTAEIKALRSMDEAIATAIDVFKRDRGLPCWSALADGYEVAYEPKSGVITTDRGAVTAADGFEGRPGGDPHATRSRRRTGTRPSGPSRSLTAEEIRRIAGPLSDAAVARIMESGATVGEVLAAHQWLTSDDTLSVEPDRPLGARVRWLCELLEAELPDAEDE